MGVTPSGLVKANRGVRARVHAVGKVPEGDDQPTLLQYITIRKLSRFTIRARKRINGNITDTSFENTGR